VFENLPMRRERRGCQVSARYARSFVREKRIEDVITEQVREWHFFRVSAHVLGKLFGQSESARRHPRPECFDVLAGALEVFVCGRPGSDGRNRVPLTRRSN